ncbi:bis(5'-nucleosyl)-tetraphosphatase (symmetrical) YqeK [Allofustis seminis]|uniref:bis(5'-nucleosyl)-tetraphosphatase (symmetrical) YqeK n=1 Tax=Allofustis seminis TaxID=166939 RepID=UPI00037ACE2F|nr:bis(5'-nucleosyl)-tetraphosphatase (symmetrical) YqeK [Allofustis seminis]
MTTIKYSTHYIDLTREQLLKKVAAAMSSKRFEHVMRVEQTALDLARRYGANEEKTSIAALLHDFAKEAPDHSMRDLIISENLDLDLLSFGNAVWHGPTGAILANKMFGIEDDEILQAIAEHTCGSLPHAPLVQKIVFVADFIEPARDFPAVEHAREIAKRSLDAAVFFELQHTLKYLLEKEARIYPKTLQNYNAWISENEKGKE